MKKIQRVPLADYPYDIVFSIGNACGCAWYLKRCKLRLCAGPLDWVRGAETLEERVAIIANRFPNWLSPDNLTPFESDGARFITTDKTCGIRFIHDFRCAMPFAEELALVQAKYARRQTRFFEKVDQAQHVLLVWFNCLVPPASEETHRRALAQLRRALGNQVDLLSIEHDATLAMGESHVGSTGSGLFLFRLNMDKSGSGTPQDYIFGDTPKAIKAILSRVRLRPDLTKRARRHEWAFRVGRRLRFLLACFVPSRRLRQKIRQKRY